MPVRRVVQDSDEEDNLDHSPSHQAEHRPVAPSPLDMADAQMVKSPQPTTTAGPISSSTELLDREIQDAHTKLVESSTSRSSRSSHLPSDSPSASRRRAPAEIGDDRAKKPKITYRARKSQDNSLLEVLSDDEEPIERRKWARGSVNPGQDPEDEPQEQRGCDANGEGSYGATEDLNDSTQSSINAPADKHGRIRSRSLRAADASMPPPASKSSGSTSLHLPSSGGSTIPFTEQASSPPAPSEQISSETTQATCPKVSDLGRSSSVTPRVRKRAASEVGSPKIILGEEIPPSSSAPAESPIKRQRTGASILDLRSPTRLKEPAGGHDELYLSAATSPQGKIKRIRLSKAASTKTDSVEELGSDDLTLGLPKENYQPRPSRSRSALVSDDLLIPEDFSKRPEALAKSKTKAKTKVKFMARKPTASEDITQQQADTLPEIDTNVPDSRSQGNACRDSIPIEHTLPRDLDITNHPAEVEGSVNGLAKNRTPEPAPPKKSRGRPKKGTAPQQSTVEPLSIEPPPATEANQEEPSSPTKPGGPTQAPAKRGRKRKRATEGRDDDVTRAQPDDSRELQAAPKGILKESNANIQQTSTANDEAAKKRLDDCDLLAAPEKSITPTGHPADDNASPNLKVAEKKTPMKQSPGQQDGKSVYRVGLSKRQRIPSLLRVVRK